VRFLKGQACFVTRVYARHDMFFLAKNPTLCKYISLFALYLGALRDEMSENYGVFTLERQDLVDLSRRIAQCIPKNFLRNRNKPIVIAVDGSIRCGKKIVADYGRAAALGIEHEDIHFASNESVPTQIKVDPTNFDKIKNLLRRMVGALKSEPEIEKTVAIVSNNTQPYCHGNAEYDEYVSADIDGDKIEVSFINVAWGHDYSFGDEVNNGKCYKKHLAERHAGGVIYVHNADLSNIQPDIEIKLESGSASSVNGQPRSCHDVKHALEMAIGKEGAEKFGEWGRFVSVAFNNSALDEGGVMSQMLKNEFGFRVQADIPAKLLEFAELQGDDTQADEIAIDTEDFPLAKKYARHIQTASACNEPRDEQKAAVIQQRLSECAP
jgi:hypothetical protein